jgi:hypothetical protein
VTIGTHRVEVFADRNAAGWGLPLFTNSYFDVDLAGWATAPFGHAWTWSSGSATFTNPDGGGGSAINRTEAATVARPPNVREYRVRATVTVPLRSDVFIRLHFGKTRNGAAVGPFWAPGEAVEQWGTSTLQPGTSTVEYVFHQYAPPDPTYVFLGVSLSLGPNPAGTTPTYSASVSSLEVHYRSAGASADLSCLVDDVAIVHGRGDTTGQPDASAATVNLTADPALAPLPAVVDVGAVLVVSTIVGATTSVRFTGRVTDMALGWDDAGADTPDAGVGQIVAVGILADLARRTVGAEPWPVEKDGVRVARVADLAGVPLDPRWSDPGTVNLLARDVDASDALGIMHDAAESAGGMVWQTRAGDVRYADADHRRGAAPSLDLDACDVLVSPTWTRNLDGLVNAVSVGYGEAPEGGSEQPRYVAEDLASITKWGRYAISPTTELAALADATAMGQLVLVRNNSPVWVMSDLPVDMADLDATATDAALALDVHALVRLTGLPAIAQAPTSAVLWVEGWRERLAWGVHDLELVVSGFCRTSPPPRWNDLSPTWTWDTVPAALTWDAATCLGPGTDLGRWDDVPASKRWDDLTTTTWDQWTATPTTQET